MEFEDGNHKGQLIAALQHLAQSNDRSKRARLIEIFSEVEAALASGTTQKQVIATLEKKGLTFTLRSFETTYARIRKERKERNIENGSTTATAKAETPNHVKKTSGEQESALPTPTGFHRVAAELAERQNSGDPRRNE